MILSELKILLRNQGIHLSRNRGQNFLIDENLVGYLMKHTCIRSSDCILEIGTGLGVLTEALLRAGARVVSYEIDRKIFLAASTRLCHHPNLTLLHEDFLKADFLKYFTRPPRVISNIPYHIASQILIRLWTVKEKISDMVLLVQKELAERLLSSDHSNVGMLSVMLQLDYTMRIMKKVPGSCFFPSPVVDSVYLEFIPKPSEIKENERPLFFRFVKSGFSQKRKQLLPRLLKEYKTAAFVFNALGLRKEIRAESLDPDIWYQLFKRLRTDHSKAV
ncbi:MAG: ribosomal RNA small subunit methyltransferase A [Candidatus Aureabacteria bacterium]|nr:ribosomal RNA small subunit methyltransferase A [Candidatus Auribacterota bacterium]